VELLAMPIKLLAEQLLRAVAVQVLLQVVTVALKILRAVLIGLLWQHMEAGAVAQVLFI